MRMTESDDDNPAPRRRRLLARFRDDANGVTAIEFAFVASPFFLLLFAILQTAMVFLAGQLFETAASRAARMVRTGEAQATFDQAAFIKEICDSTIMFPDCENKILIDVQDYGSFEEAAANIRPPEVDDEGEFEDDSTYERPPGDTIVVVKAFYVWDLIVPTFGIDLADIPGHTGKRMMGAAVAFRTEPF